MLHINSLQDIPAVENQKFVTFCNS